MPDSKTGRAVKNRTEVPRTVCSNYWGQRNTRHPSRVNLFTTYTVGYTAVPSPKHPSGVTAALAAS